MPILGTFRLKAIKLLLGRKKQTFVGAVECRLNGCK